MSIEICQGIVEDHLNKLSTGETQGFRDIPRYGGSEDVDETEPGKRDLLPDIRRYR